MTSMLARTGCPASSARQSAFGRATQVIPRLRARVVAARATITEEAASDLPWAKPGWRGAYLSAQPESVQQAAFAGIAVALVVGAYITHTVIGPWVCENVPFLDLFPQNSPFILGPMFVAAGVLHFTAHEMFCGFYPCKGAWGFWNLPGSPSFHVNWTGVAEILGGLGLVLGALHLDFLPEGLESASAYGLCLLTYVVSPSNFYMWSHNAPGPFTEEDLDKNFGPGGAAPQYSHVIRFLLQIFLLSAYLGMASS